jgi:DNA-binding XRE family transcriptional regulator
MMINKKLTNYEDYKAEVLKDEATRKEYDALTPKYEVIRQLIIRRNKMRMSQTELARIVGLKQPAISRLERGNSNTTIGTFLKVTQALNLSIELRAMETNVRGEKASRKLVKA